MADWRDELRQAIEGDQSARKSAAETRQAAEERGHAWLVAVVEPALQEVKAELERLGRSAEVNVGTRSASITIRHGGTEELRFTVVADGVRPYPKIRGYDRGRAYESEGTFRSGAQDYTIDDIGKDEIIRKAVSEFRQTVETRRLRGE